MKNKKVVLGGDILLSVIRIWEKLYSPSNLIEANFRVIYNIHV
ncbi:hypothetical protein MESMT1_0849 [Methanosarcina thermophila]|uniref:Uncharacterized protein n=1 Tax=Methanosarcina thermophila TaxID=2210 RepID=A0A3G9CUY1_METTE|nr:hypothetical protein MESMT1_0849 [Methanosarcina thermophila]